MKGPHTFNPDFICLLERGENLFRNPDGSYLAFALSWQKGGQGEWTRGTWHDDLVRPVDRSVSSWKRGLGKLGLRTSRTNIFWIAVDFDKLWGKYLALGEEAGWEQLRQDLETIAPESSIVVSSPSGKAKLLICFKSNRKPLSLSRRHLKDALKSVVPAELLEHADDKGGALDVVFLFGLSMISKISARLPFAKPISFILPDQAPSLASTPGQHHAACCTPLSGSIDPLSGSIDPFTGPLPETLLPFVRNAPGKECFVRLLLGTFEDELDLPTTYLAARIKEVFPGRKTPQQKICRYIKDFEEQGLLELVDGHYRPTTSGRKGKARRFRLTAQLLEARDAVLLGSLAHRKKGFSTSEQIPDGSWTSRLFSAALFFKNRKAYVSWVISRHGLNPSRIRRAVNAWADAEVVRRRRLTKHSAEYAAELAAIEDEIGYEQASA